MDTKTFMDARKELEGKTPDEKNQAIWDAAMDLARSGREEVITSLRSLVGELGKEAKEWLGNAKNYEGQFAYGKADVLRETQQKIQTIIDRYGGGE